MNVEQVINYNNSMTVSNLDSLPAGRGCQFLLVIEGIKEDHYIAKRWMRKVPAVILPVERVIRFWGDETNG